MDALQNVPDRPMTLDEQALLNAHNASFTYPADRCVLLESAAPFVRFYFVYDNDPSGKMGRAIKWDYACGSWRQWDRVRTIERGIIDRNMARAAVNTAPQEDRP